MKGPANHEAAPSPFVVDVQLTHRELSLICKALDSHAYWQLSDPHYRRDGYVSEPGSDDEEKVAELAQVEKLLDRLEPALLR